MICIRALAHLRFIACAPPEPSHVLRACTVCRECATRRACAYWSPLSLDVPRSAGPPSVFGMRPNFGYLLEHSRAYSSHRPNSLTLRNILNHSPHTPVLRYGVNLRPSSSDCRPFYRATHFNPYPHPWKADTVPFLSLWPHWRSPPPMPIVSRCPRWWKTSIAIPPLSLR